MKPQTVLSVKVYKAKEMCCFIETHILFGQFEIFPNRRLFDSSPHLKSSLNLLTGSFNKSFLNRLKFWSGQMRGFYEKRPRYNKLQPINAVFTKPTALPQTRLYCRHDREDMSFIAQPRSVSLWEPPAGGGRVQPSIRVQHGKDKQKKQSRRRIHDHISS